MAAPVAILYQNKLAIDSPSVTFATSVERFQTDSYSVRATIGINPNKETWTLSWNGLTTAETKALVSQLRTAKGVDLLLWQSPLSDVDQTYSCAEYSADPFPAVVGYWRVSATLQLEFDNV